MTLLEQKRQIDRGKGREIEGVSTEKKRKKKKKKLDENDWEERRYTER